MTLEPCRLISLLDGLGIDCFWQCPPRAVFSSVISTAWVK